jgi:Uma2 family endonuclease
VAEPARRLWTLDEFLAFDDGTDKRYELFDGQIVAMAPASDVHGALVMRIGRQIGNALRPGCEVIAEAGIVPPERANSWYQADLVVTCAGLTGQQFITEPILIVEVLSPTTAATDRAQAPRRLQAAYDLKRARRTLGERLRREITPHAA